MMKVKPCPCCGEEVLASEGYKKPFTYFIRCLTCGMQTDRHDKKEDAIDVWNARYELNPSVADRWLNEAIEQRARADKSEEMVAFLKDQLARVANFNCDWDMLKACQASWRELASEHNKLKKEHDQLNEALEQAKRMLDYAGKLQ